jgi:UDP-glucose:(heptosyl)LPS alpha-1,3-glucosyltransferase
VVERPLIGLGAFHRNMLALEARTFDPANTKHVIVNSEMVRGEIARHFPAFPQERIHLVRNGVEVRRFQNTDRAAARMRVLASQTMISCSSSSAPAGSAKDCPGCSIHGGRIDDPKLKLLVVTRDRMRGRVPPNVILTGPLSDVETAYAAADLLTFLPIYEPCSNVVSEALATGIPVITTSFNGASELIDPASTATSSMIRVIFPRWACA